MIDDKQSMHAILVLCTPIFFSKTGYYACYITTTLIFPLFADTTVNLCSIGSGLFRRGTNRGYWNCMKNSSCWLRSSNIPKVAQWWPKYGISVTLCWWKHSNYSISHQPSLVAIIKSRCVLCGEYPTLCVPKLQLAIGARNKCTSVWLVLLFVLRFSHVFIISVWSGCMEGCRHLVLQFYYLLLSN